MRVTNDNDSGEPIDCFKAGMSRIGALERQDNVRKSIEQAEKFIVKLKPGANYFTPDQYSAIVFWFWPIDNDKARDMALKAGKFSPPGGIARDRIEIIKVHWLREDRLVSLEDLSKQTGIPYRTLWGKIKKLNLPQKVVGRKKLYNIDDLRERLSDKLE